MGNKTVQRLMEEAPRGQPLDTVLLRDLGVSPALASHMVSAGWLRRLAQGTYMLTGDEPSRDGVLAYLSRRVPGLHVGGKTALDWQGVRHNIAFKERILLWGYKPYAFQAWVAERIMYDYQTTKLFDGEFDQNTGLKSLPNGNKHVLVSIPERALLEMASDIGKTPSLEEARNLMGSMRNIRAHVLDDLLKHCTRVKVVKLVRDLGDAEQLKWAAVAHQHVARLGGAGKRWSNKTRSGIRLTLKP